MSKPTYRELATNFTLWCKFVLLEEQVSEREFNEMSIDEKLDILQGCFGHETQSESYKTGSATPELTHRSLKKLAYLFGEPLVRESERCAVF